MIVWASLIFKTGGDILTRGKSSAIHYTEITYTRPVCSIAPITQVFEMCFNLSGSRVIQPCCSLYYFVHFYLHLTVWRKRSFGHILLFSFDYVVAVIGGQHLTTLRVWRGAWATGALGRSRTSSSGWLPQYRLSHPLFLFCKLIACTSVLCRCKVVSNFFLRCFKKGFR